MAWLLEATGGYGVKLVNPGGVEMWKHGNAQRHGARRRGRAARASRRARVLETLADAVNALGLPHPVHIHCNNLGVAGQLAHHAGDHATPWTAGGRTSPTSSSTATAGRPAGGRARGAPELAEHVNAHPELTADVGQVMFGPRRR